MNTNILREFFESLYCSRQRLYLSNSIFSKNSIEEIFLNVKKYHFFNIIFQQKKICSIESAILFTKEQRKQTLKSCKNLTNLVN